MLSVQHDTSSRYASTRVSAALDELQKVDIPEPARSRITYLLQAARGDFTATTDDFGSDATVDWPAPSRLVLVTDGSNMIPFRPRPR